MQNWNVVVLEADCPLNPSTCQMLEAAGCRLIHVLEAGEESLLTACRHADAVLTFLTPISARVIEAMEQCKSIVRLGVGYDSVDFHAAKRCGIPVSNVPDYCMGEVADHAMALALTLTRGLPTLQKTVEGGGWFPTLPFPMRSSAEMTFGIIGLGRIGRATAERARAFRFRLVAHDPYLEEGAFREMGTEPLSLEETLKQSDVLSLHTPLTAETHHLLNAERLSLMKPTSILINTARGKIVDTVALAEALKNCQLGAAGIDVFEEEPLPEDHPLRTSPNTLLSPHWAWHSTESELRLHKMGAEEALRGLRGETLRSRINF